MEDVALEIKRAKQRNLEEDSLPPCKIVFKSLAEGIFGSNERRKEAAKETENSFYTPRTYCGDTKYCSTKDLHELTRIELSDMQARKRHEGKYLVCKVATAPFITVSIHIYVLSPCGENMLCCIYNYPCTPPPVKLADLDCLFPVGQIILIKEPWIKMSMATENKAPLIRVDSPTDIVLLDSGDSILESIRWRDPIVMGMKFPILSPKLPSLDVNQWKALGNKLFEEKKYFQAMSTYSNGIKQHPSPSTSYLLFLNRALMYIHLERFSSALQDCNAVLPFLKLSSSPPGFLEKALFRRSTALYSLRRWKAAKEAFKDLHDQFNKGEYKQSLDKVEQRISEEASGDYNISNLMNSASKCDKMDVADFYGNVAIMDNPEIGGGRGIKTIRAIKAGEILMANKAISSGTFNPRWMITSLNLNTNVSESSCSVAVRNNLVQKLLDQPELAPSVYSLYPGPKRAILNRTSELAGPKDLGDTIVPTVPIDVEYIEKVCSFNSFNGKANFRGEDLNQLMNPVHLFVGTSLINHSCNYNAIWTTYADFQIIRAIKPIPANEEVFISYVANGSYQERQKKLSNFFKRCECSLCLVDRSDGEDNLAKREKLLERENDETTRNRINEGRNFTTTAVKQLIARREKFIANMESTYRNERVIRPEMCVAYHQLAFAIGLLVSISRDNSHYKRMIEFEKKALVASGIVLNENSKDEYPIVLENGPQYDPDHCIKVAVQIATTYFALENRKESIKWIKAAEWIHRITIDSGKERFKKDYSDNNITQQLMKYL